MDTTALLLSVVGTLAGVVSAYLAYVAVRHQLSGRRRRIAPGPDPAPAPAPSAGPFDVFVSYAPQDAVWVRAFAERLRALGVAVAYDEVVRRPGGVRVHTVEEAVRRSAHGLLVFSPASAGGAGDGRWGGGWAGQEYAALMQPSIETGRLFIPVVIGDVRLPEFAATRYSADFRGADDAAYTRLVEEIAAALRPG